jgi:hypothetical protein
MSSRSSTELVNILLAPRRKSKYINSFTTLYMQRIARYQCTHSNHGNGGKDKAFSLG